MMFLHKPEVISKILVSSFADESPTGIPSTSYELNKLLTGEASYLYECRLDPFARRVSGFKSLSWHQSFSLS